MSKSSSEATEKPESVLRMARVNCNMFASLFFLRYYNADIFRFTTTPLMNCIYSIC